jgi:hypothetical protein
LGNGFYNGHTWQLTMTEKLMLWPKRATQRLSFSEGAAELKIRIETQSEIQTFACSLS